MVNWPPKSEDKRGQVRGDIARVETQRLMLGGMVANATALVGFVVA